MRFFLLFAYVTAFVWLFESHAQQNINSLTTKDIKVNGNLEVNSTSLASKPCPVMTEAQRNAIPSPQSGRCIYNSNSNQLNIYNGTIWKSVGGGISNWETAFNYALNDVVIYSAKIYQANTAHTSTSFASDIANWTIISNDLPIDLASEVSGILPMANGGTDKALTPTLGGVVYTDANSMEVLGAGTSGQVLKSNGAAAPTWQDSSNKLQGEKQSEVSFTKLKARNRSVTQTGTGEYLLEDQENLLYNGNSESATLLDGWTCTNSGDFSAETTVPLDGNKSLKVQPLTVGGYTCYQDFNINQFQRGQSVLLSAMVRASGDDTLQICYRENGVVTSICSQAVSNGIPATEAVIGSSATSIGYQFTIPYNSLGLVVRMDKFDMRYGTAVTNQPAIGPEFSWTPVTQGLGTISPSTNACSGNQSGTNLILTCRFTTGTIPAGVEVRIGLPNNLTVSSSVSGVRKFGDIFRGVATGPTIKRFTAVSTNGLNYLNVGVDDYTSASSPLVAGMSNALFSSGETVVVQAIIPIAQYASSVPTYTGRCNDPRKCRVDFDAYINTSGVPSKQTFGTSYPWISGNCSKSGTSNFITRCPLVDGLVTQAMNCKCTTDASGIGYNCDFSASGASSSQIEFYTGYGTGTVANVGITISCSKQGQDAFNALTLQQNVALKSYVQTPNTTGKVGFCSAKISATGVISDQLGGCFASCTNATTPVCTFTSNYWKSGSVPNCWHISNAAAFTGQTQGLISSTSFGGIILNSGGTGISGDRQYFCHGEIQ